MIQTGESDQKPQLWAILQGGQKWGQKGGQKGGQRGGQKGGQKGGPPFVYTRWRKIIARENQGNFGI